MTRKFQNSFTGGELTPAAWARADIQKYQFGLRKAKNGFVHAHGGFSNRPGTEYILRTKHADKESRLIPFAFSTQQTYMLEFGDQYMRVFKDGGIVLESGQTISGATQASPCVLTVTGHSRSAGEWVYVQDVVGMTELNGKFYKIANPTTNTYELTDLDGNNIDSSAYAAYTSGGTSSPVYELSTPYTEANLDTLKYTQSADVMTIVSREYQPRELTRTGHSAWTLSTITFAPQTSAPATGSCSGGSAGSYDLTYRITAVDADTGEESLSKETNTITSKKRPNDGATGGLVDVTWAAVTNASQYNIYRSDSGSVFGFVGIADASSTTFKDHITKPDFDDPAPGTSATNPFSGADDYPGTVAYHLQRLDFASSNNDPQRTWMTQVGNYKNMNKSVPTKDDDSIVFTIAAQQVNEIRHMVPLRDLVILTSGGEWIAKGSEDGVLTPANIQIRPQTFYGAANVSPVVIGNTVIFVQEKGSIVRDLAYTFESDGYSGNELSILSDHLFRGYTIKEWCYAQAPYSLVWAVRDDGRALSMTYQREHQVWAWTWHETDGEFESVASVSEGTRDVVYFIVKRYINGQWVRIVERMADREFSDIRDAFFVDSGLSYLGAPKAIEDVTVESSGRRDVTITITGHGFSDGDLIDVSDAIMDQSALKDEDKTQINGRRYQVAESTTNNFKLRTEYALQNEFTAPDDFTDGTWSTSDITVTTGQTDPFGGTGAAKIEVTATGYAAIVESITNAKAMSFWVKIDTSNDKGITIGGQNSRSVYDMDAIGDGEWHKITHIFTDDDTIAGLGFYEHGSAPVTGDIYYIYWPHANFDGTVPDLIQERDGYVDGAGFGEHVKNGYVRTPKETLSGLDHLEGETVSALVDGSPQRDLVVTSGSITLSRAGSRVHVGMPYQTDMETLNLDIPEANSFGRAKSSSHFTAIVEKTRGMSIGPNENKLYDFKQRSDEEYNEPTRMTTGEYSSTIAPSWHDNGRIFLRQDDPLPMTVLGVIPEVDIGG